MKNLFGDSDQIGTAGVKGEFKGKSQVQANGVEGFSEEGNGVLGISHGGHGVHGESIKGRGVHGISQEFFGVSGFSTKSAGVHGQSALRIGVIGEAVKDIGVLGSSMESIGVQGAAVSQPGVQGLSKSGVGVNGISESGDGVVGTGRRGVVGFSQTFQGVSGKSIENAGVVAESDKFHAVFAICHDPNNGAVFGENKNGGFGVVGVSETGIGVAGRGGRLAGRFDGDVEVTGDIRLANADCAEDFDVVGAVKVEPGTVMVLGNEGSVSESYQAYDKRVAGVISGAGNYKPGIVLDKQQTSGNRQPIALMGKVFCKVDAQFGAIELGDLLTSSPTPGHAMKTNDPFKAFGAVIGKALRPLAEGQGLIPILIALQ